MFDYKKLRLKILEKFECYSDFATFFGKSNNYVTRYMHEYTYFDQPTIFKWCDALDIPYDEIPIYFFALKVDEA